MNVLRWLPLVFLVMVGVLGVVMPKFRPGIPVPKPLRPVLMLELPASNDELDGLLKTTDAPTSAAANTRCDYWFITAYTLLFLSLALFHAWPLRTALFIVAAATASLDLWENAVIWRFIGGARNHADILFPAYAKWFCFFAALALVALLFRSGWWWIVAIVALLPALAGMAGVLLRSRLVIVLATDVAVVALAVATVATVIRDR